MKHYTLFHPDFDLEKNALTNVLEQEDLLPYANYVVAQNSAPHKLSQEFLKFLCSYRSIKNLFFHKFIKKNKWQQIPLYACCLNSATSGLTASLWANGITSGEVITTSFNYVGVGNAIVMAGAKPQFVDIDPKTFCLDPKKLAAAITKNTKAIILVHVNQMIDLEPIAEVLSKKGVNIPVISDASLAIGSNLDGLPAGLINLGKGGTTVFSFATSKILSGLGGAVVVGHDLELITKIQSIAYQGFDFQDMSELVCFGANFKMCDLNASLILEQLKKREQIFSKRRQIKTWYDENLADLVKAKKISIQEIKGQGIVTHYMILMPKRQQIAQELIQKRIQLGMWHSLHTQPIYQKRFKYKKGSLPITEKLVEQISFLPFHTKLEKTDVKFICEAIKKAIS
ncbi:MAG: DegT/DnrJ/EryC1/StrS family aminotransferase [Pseudomonadota bacterium]